MLSLSERSTIHSTNLPFESLNHACTEVENYDWKQESMTRSEQLPHEPYVIAFLETDIFLEYLFRKKQRQFRLDEAMTSS